MRQILTFLILLSFSGLVKAQESAVFSHYYVHPFMINPGFAGFENHELLMNYRSNWVGFPGAPKGYAISYNGPLGDRSGIGAMLFRETIASWAVTKFQANYAYRFKVEDFKVGVGLTTEFQSEKIKNDESFDSNDAVLSDALDAYRIFDVSFGVYAKNRNGLFVGFTLPNLVRTRLDEVTSGKDDLSSFKNYTFNLGYEHIMPDYNMTIEPSIMLRKYREVPFQVDINMLASILDRKLFGGVSYRAGVTGKMGLLAGARWQFGTLYYSFNYSFQKLQDYSGGGHELSLIFNLNEALSQDSEIGLE